jgi:two-component system nitrogen regulation response regulator GlnG
MEMLLLVDDDPLCLQLMARQLAGPGRRLLTATTGAEAVALAAEHRPELALLDVGLPDQSGLEVADRLRSLDPELVVVMVSGCAATETMIEAMKRGAFEYMLKPLDLGKLRAMVDHALRFCRAAQDGGLPLKDGDAGDDVLLGRSPAMLDVCKAIGRVAGQDVTVLLEGESGTGKELVARILHQHSRRGGGPFLAINCAAIPDALLENELFGHERGAFTGADRRFVGKVEQAHRGTVFLDEIADMSMATQAKVLRLLQEHQFSPLGSHGTVLADIRVIAATNRDLEGCVAAGKFREDLFYRLNVVTIRLPPLRDRRGDVPLLVEQFRKRFNGEMGKSVRVVAPETLRLLEHYPWPGNVRELQSVLKNAFLRAPGAVLTAECLPDGLMTRRPAVVLRLEDVRGQPMAARTSAELPLAALVQSLLRPGQADLFRQVGREVDRVVLEEVLRHTRGNQVEASRILGISRTTLRAKLRDLAGPAVTPGQDLASLCSPP